MGEMNLIPTGAFGGGDGWGDAGAAALGAFFGSWFGNGAMGNRFGYGNGVVGDGAVAAGASAFGTNLVMDNLNQIQNGITNLGMNVVQGQGDLKQAVGNSTSQLQNTLCQGFSGVTANDSQNAYRLQNSINQGFAGINATVNGTNAMTNNYLAQGFAGLNTAITNNGYESRLAVQDLARQNADCCCGIKTAVQAEGAATRQLIQNNLITELQTKLCDAKAKNAALESQAFTCASNASQTRDIINTILPHIVKSTAPAD